MNRGDPPGPTGGTMESRSTSEGPVQTALRVVRADVHGEHRRSAREPESGHPVVSAILPRAFGMHSREH